MPKRVLNRIRLDKIAAVDKPCQAHATVAIIKRAPAQQAPAIAKATFEEALQAQLISDRVTEIFWRAFDKQWAVREAFREALTDELAAGGDGSAATDGFIDATRTIAEKAVELAREAGSAASDQDLESAVEQAVEKWLGEQENVMTKITTKALLKAAVASFDPATTPFAKVAEIKLAARDLGAEDELPAEGPLAKDAPAADPKVEKLERQVAELRLTPDVRKHYDGLAEAGKVAFLAKSADDQAAEVEAATSADPVIYKTAGGVEIRKSDGVTAALLAKQLDEANARMVKLEARADGDTIEKRAVEQYPNVAKAVAVDMLTTIEKLGKDSVAGKAVQTSLDAMNKGARTLFKTLGSTEGVGEPGEAGVAKARVTFNAKCAEIAKRDGIGPADAMSKAREEAPELFAEAYPETPDVDAE